MERAGFEADRQRLMLVGRADGRTGGPSLDATKGWTLSVGSYTWCPDSKCIFAVVEERGRDNIYRIEVPSFRRSLAVAASGVISAVSVAPTARPSCTSIRATPSPARSGFPRGSSRIIPIQR